MTDFLANKLGVSGPTLVTRSQKVDDYEKIGGASLDKLLGVKAFGSNVQPTIEIKDKKLPPGAAFGDSIIHQMYLDEVSAELMAVADITAKEEAEIKEKLQKSQIKFLVVHIWEANLSGFLSSTKIWNFQSG